MYRLLLLGRPVILTKAVTHSFLKSSKTYVPTVSASLKCACSTIFQNGNEFLGLTQLKFAHSIQENCPKMDV